LAKNDRNREAACRTWTSAAERTAPIFRGLKVSLKPGEKAVCIGTVRYNHNEFLEITKASIVDDYERANAEFKKKFGSRYPPHKALLTPAK
jgi:hypothetical protein